MCIHGKQRFHFYFNVIFPVFLITHFISVRLLMFTQYFLQLVSLLIMALVNSFNFVCLSCVAVFSPHLSFIHVVYPHLCWSHLILVSPIDCDRLFTHYFMFYRHALFLPLWSYFYNLNFSPFSFLVSFSPCLEKKKILCIPFVESSSTHSTEDVSLKFQAH